MTISQALAVLKNILLFGLAIKSFAVFDSWGASTTHHKNVWVSNKAFITVDLKDLRTHREYLMVEGRQNQVG
jgi:hypothetical protein